MFVFYNILIKVFLLKNELIFLMFFEKIFKIAI